MVHSILPLAVLEAVRNLDTPVEDGLSEFAEELLVKRLGLSSTVAMQLERYAGLVRRDARVEPEQLEALLRLVGRRPDAELVFADAGRRAARRAARRVFPLRRLLAHIGPRAGGVPVAVLPDAITIRATPDGAACGLWAAALAELLRLLTGFEGAMRHTACRATGAAQCESRAAPPDPRHH